MIKRNKEKDNKSFYFHHSNNLEVHFARELNRVLNLVDVAGVLNLYELEKGRYGCMNENKIIVESGI